MNECNTNKIADFTTTLAYDVVKSRGPDAFSDHSDQVSRRMGFVPLPLSILVIRIVLQIVQDWQHTDFIVLAVIYVFLLTLKILNSIVLLGQACNYVQTYESMQQRAELLARITRREQTSKSVPATPPRLKLIEFNGCCFVVIHVQMDYLLVNVMYYLYKL